MHRRPPIWRHDGQVDGCGRASFIYLSLGRGTPIRPSRSITRLDSMAEIPARRGTRSRRIAVRLAWIAWASGIIATALGFTAGWLPAFDLINEARPIHA